MIIRQDYPTLFEGRVPLGYVVQNQWASDMRVCDWTEANHGTGWLLRPNETWATPPGYVCAGPVTVYGDEGATFEARCWFAPMPRMRTAQDGRDPRA